MFKSFYSICFFVLFLSTPALASTNVENNDSALQPAASDLLADADTDISDFEAEVPDSDSPTPNKEPASEAPPPVMDDTAGGDDTDTSWGADE